MGLGIIAGIIKGAKFLYKHKEEIKYAGDVARKFTGMDDSCGSGDYEEEYAALPAANSEATELNEEQMSRLLAEIAAGLESLEQSYNATTEQLKTMAADVVDNSHRIAALTEDQSRFEDGIRANADTIEKLKQDLVRLAGSVNETSETARKIKQDCAQQIAAMEQQMKALEAAQAADRKKAEDRYGNMCIFLVLGVAAAITLAILL